MRRILPATALLLAIAAAAPAAGASPYVIHGRGFGHGIGMSQWGAFGYARHGRSYDQILTHYYRGTTLGTTSSRPIRVLLESGRGSISFAGATAAGSRRLRRASTYTAALRAGRVVLSAAGRRVGAFSAPLAVTSSAGSVRLGGPALNGVFDGAYRGGLELRASPAGGLTALNVVALDDYVKGVVPGEVPARWPGEALKAQAVAARSYALVTHAGGSIFDQYPDTRSQVYRGMDGERPRTSAAVDATARQVVRYRGAIATTYFFSASGGHTEDVENVFYGASPSPYLRGVSDPFDGSAPRHRWTVTLTRAQLTSRLAGLVKGRFIGIEVVKRGVSRRIVLADVIGTGGSTRVRGATVKSRLGLLDTWARFPALGGHQRARAVAAAEPLPGVPVPLPVTEPPGARPVAPQRDSGANGFSWPATAWNSRRAAGG